jgi:hypothetical protein
MIIQRIYLLVIVFISYGEYAQAADDTVYVRGVGTATCGKFAEMYRTSPDSSEMYYLSWAQGLMSGINIVAQKGMKRDLMSMDFEEQKRFIREYCDSHPLATYASAVAELFGKLKITP